MSENEEFREVSQSPSKYHRGLLAATVLFLATTVGSLVYIRHQGQETRRLAEGYDQMSVALNQTRAQLESVSSQLKILETPPPPPEPAPVAAKPAPAQAAPGKPAGARRKSTKRAERPAEDPRWKQVEAKLDEHQKMINSTRQDVEKARFDLEGKLTSTRDELNTSIARNHEELVVLQKRGERNYYEFRLTKSKQFTPVGPLSLALRKAHTKKLYCDLELVVDDSKLKRNRINLYEPVLLYPADYAQPLEVVINRIDKDEARGYVSVPKFRQSELLAAGQPASPAAPVQSAPTPAVKLEHRAAAPPQ